MATPRRAVERAYTRLLARQEPLFEQFLPQRDPVGVVHRTHAYDLGPDR
ncbi:MAG: hypothetical protein ACXWPK_10530 [Isosphaeraceae bacterium]